MLTRRCHRQDAILLGTGTCWHMSPGLGPPCWEAHSLRGPRGHGTLGSALPRGHGDVRSHTLVRKARVCCSAQPAARGGSRGPALRVPVCGPCDPRRQSRCRRPHSPGSLVLPRRVTPPRAGARREGAGDPSLVWLLHCPRLGRRRNRPAEAQAVRGGQSGTGGTHVPVLNGSFVPHEVRTTPCANRRRVPAERTRREPVTLCGDRWGEAGTRRHGAEGTGLPRGPDRTDERGPNPR